MHTKRKLWQAPWAYRESFLIAIALLVIAYLLEWLTGGSIQTPSFPSNLIILCLYMALQVWMYLADRTTALVQWLRSVPAAVSAIALLVTQAVIMGTLPQQSMSADVAAHPLGFHNVMGSWPFVLTIIYLLTTLGQITLHRSIPLKWANWPFIINHLGLWIAIAAGTLGSGDVQRLSMTLHEGETENRAIDGIHFRKMDFSLQLDSFVMDTYAPKLALLDTRTNLLDTKTANALRPVVADDRYESQGYQIRIVEYLPNAEREAGRYRTSNVHGAAPAVLVQVQGHGIDTTGWLSCGSFAVLPGLLQLDAGTGMVLLEPEAKTFESHVIIHPEQGKSHHAVIEVNKPSKINGWKIYQVSYDTKLGKYSTTSIVELVRDPWLPVVYVGLFMMMLGAVRLIFRA